MKNIYLLGATGSIGSQTLEIVDQNPNEFKIISLSARKRINELILLVEKYNPKFVSVEKQEDADQLSDRYPHIVFGYGETGLIHAATYNPKDENALVVNALVGISGLVPTIEAMKLGRNIALANKETLVVGGSIVMNLVKEKNVTIFPIDSEHSAIWQCLNGEKKETIKKVIITASGGSFRDKTREELKNVTKEDALNHPNWVMGDKITIDSATMMNKGFEIIEAMHLFDLSLHQIEPLLHRESIIHSMVEFSDASIIAQLSNHSMLLPIQYALFYPNRQKAVVDSLDLASLKSLHFGSINLEQYPCFNQAMKAASIGGSMPCVLNAANEAAVDLFLRDKISFLEIDQVIEKELSTHETIQKPTLDQLLSIDQEVKNRIYQFYTE